MNVVYGICWCCSESRTIPRIYQNCLIESFEDFLYTFKLLLQENFKSIRYITEEKIKKEEYMDLYSPALEWLLQNIGKNKQSAIYIRCAHIVCCLSHLSTDV